MAKLIKVNDTLSIDKDAIKYVVIHRDVQGYGMYEWVEIRMFSDEDANPSCALEEWKRIEQQLVEPTPLTPEQEQAEQWARWEAWDKEHGSFASTQAPALAPSLSLGWHTVSDLMEDPEMKNLIASGKKVEAITRYRKTRVDFQEAKAVVSIAMEYAKTAPALPESVLAAWKEYDKASFEALVSFDDVAALDKRTDDLRAMFLTAFSDFVKGGES